MKCPFCRCDNDRVIETRTSDDGFVIRRRRACQSCKKRYTTYERIEIVNIRVVKRDGTRVPFDREKLRHGIERACWKRPVREAQISGLVATLETRLEGETEVSTQRIGELAMELLRKVDEIAYIRFASVYQDFANVQDFATALQSMTDEKAFDDGENAPTATDGE